MKYARMLIAFFFSSNFGKKTSGRFMMSFTISILHDGKIYTYHVECIGITAREETYQLKAKNKTLIFSNNRPFLKAKNLKHWRPTWKMHVEIWNVYFKNVLIKAIEEKIGIKSGK